MIKQFRKELKDSDYKKHQFKSFILFAAGVVVFTLIAGFLFRQSPDLRPTGRADIASDFPEGAWFNTVEPLSLYDQIKGHVVVVLFNDFNTLSDLEDLNDFGQLNSIFHDQSVICLVVSAGREPATTDSLVSQWQIDFPVLADPDSLAMRAFGIRALPGVLVIDAKGRVAARYYEDWQNISLEAVIQDLLNQGVDTRSLATEKYIPQP
ncbi:MAG: redoxin domain-containing protein [Candidatus Sabulitectum sp.]|nr:redoxin domain-containing protein [Candidatus Sabulitectum sp.]